MSASQGPGPRSDLGGARGARAHDVGSSLIEVLVAVVLLSTAGVAVLTGMATSMMAAGTHREIAGAQSVLASASDLVAGAGVRWVSCASSNDLPGHYEQAIQSQMPAGSTVDVASVQYWNGEAFGSTCLEAAGQRMQRLDLEVTFQSSSYQLAVVKRPAPDQMPSVGTVPLAGYTAPQEGVSLAAESTPVQLSGTRTCSFLVTESSATGGTGLLKIANGTSTAIAGWNVTINRGSWQLHLVSANQSVSGSTVTGSNVAWNGAVASGTEAVVTAGILTGSPAQVNHSLACQVVSTT